MPQRERTSLRLAVNLQSILNGFDAHGLLQQHQSKACGGGPLHPRPPKDGPRLLSFLYKGVADGTVYAQLSWYDEVLTGQPDPGLAELRRVVSGLRAAIGNEWLQDAALIAFSAERGSTATIFLGREGCCTKVRSLCG